MSRTPPGTIRLVEELAANATAATTVQLLDGWLVRAAEAAPFHACNSVLPYAADDNGLEVRIAFVERFYLDRDLVPRFQISPAALPADLDDVLEARGYEIEQPILVQFGDSKRVVESTSPSDFGPVAVGDGIDDYWVAEYASAHGDDEDSRERLRDYGRLLSRLGPEVSSAVLPVNGEPAAVGLAVHERGWVGVYAMGTQRRARRRGAATAVLHALADWALDRGASRMYLQVEATNDAARQLYNRAGFETAYRYHYRTLYE